MRRPAAKIKPRVAQSATFPAPVGGWVRNLNLATPNARNPDGTQLNGAYVLENWFPTATGIRMRGGSQAYARLGSDETPILSLFSYVNGNNAKLFGATANAIFDITNPPDYEQKDLVDESSNFLVVSNSGEQLAAQGEFSLPTFGGLSGGKWISTQFATPGGVFLRLVNGMDPPLIFDGTAFSTAPSITGTGLNASNLSYSWSYKNRLFFIEKDSLNAWYLTADSIGGVATKLPLGGVFTRGGSLLFGSAWSIESGTGLSEQCVFVTTEGEVAVYQGNDPSVAANWTKVGVYRIGKPRGAKAHIRAGGDLVIATDIGLVPLSQATQRDYAALSPSAVSYKIETAWNDEIVARPADWNCEVWPTKQMVLVALPPLTGETAKIFTANARTGAWGLYTGWDATCMQTFNDRLFFGTSARIVVEAEVTGADQGAPYTATAVPLFDPLKSPASLKTSQLMRATLKSSIAVVPQLSLQVDYSIRLPTPPDDRFAKSTEGWGISKWGVSQWATPAVKTTFQQWQSVGGRGYSIAPGVQITSGGVTAPDVELVQIDMTFDRGDIVT